jgi:hypothetical protein
VKLYSLQSRSAGSSRARTSSATGLYQFIDDTWLGTVKKHGDRFGLGALADQIALTPSGRARVADPTQRAAILALRNDPEVASLMAAGLAEDNRAHLTPILGRQPDHTELYLAHFLGAGGAGRFLSELQADPGQSAAALFALPAAANRAIFYTPDGSPIVGPAPGRKNFWLNQGHSFGITAAGGAGWPSEAVERLSRPAMEALGATTSEAWRVREQEPQRPSGRSSEEKIASAQRPGSEAPGGGSDGPARARKGKTNGGALFEAHGWNQVDSGFKILPP